MPPQYVLFRDDPSSHDEVYLVRMKFDRPTSVKRPEMTNLKFLTAAEGYKFARAHKYLQYWRVGLR